MWKWKRAQIHAQACVLWRNIFNRAWAARIESRINNDQFIQTSISNVSLWIKSSKNDRHKRSDVIDGIVRHQRADYLEVVLEHGWDVNEMLQVYVSGRGRVKRTALHHAVFYSWHEGVRMLLNAGANLNIKYQWSADMYRSLSLFPRFHHSTQFYFGFNPLEHIPLCFAVCKNDPQMVKLLLQSGTDLEYSSYDYIMVNQHQLRMQRWQYVESKQRENSEVLNELLIYSQNENKQLRDLLPGYLSVRQFLPEHLDVLFTHGVRIDPDDQETSLTDALGGSVNTTRWLIRHGASCKSWYPMLCLLSIAYMMLENDIDYLSILRYELPMLEVLLEAGIKPPHSFTVHLGDLRMMLAYFYQGNVDDDVINKTRKIHYNIAREVGQSKKLDQRKLSPIDRNQQMAHLREFSDHFLDIYPEEFNIERYTRQECWEQILKIISNMLHFLNQPNTLQWYCRVCLRQSLVSLSPSVIKTLPVPAALKRYILCHEL